MPVFPRMIDMVVRIIPAGVMPDPLLALIDVRGVRMPRLVTIIAVFFRGVCLAANGSRTVSRGSLVAVTPMLAFTASLRKSRD